MSTEEKNGPAQGSGSKWGDLDSIPTPKAGQSGGGSTTSAPAAPAPQPAPTAPAAPSNPAIDPVTGTSADARARAREALRAATASGTLGATPTPNTNFAAAQAPAQAPDLDSIGAETPATRIAEDEEEAPSKPHMGVIVMIVGFIGVSAFTFRIAMDTLMIWKDKTSASIQQSLEAGMIGRYDAPTALEAERMEAVMLSKGIVSANANSDKKGFFVMVQGSSNKAAKELVSQMAAEGAITSEEPEKKLVIAAQPTEFKQYSGVAGPMGLATSLPEVQNRAAQLPWITDFREQAGVITKKDSPTKLATHIYHLRLAETPTAAKKAHSWVIEVDGDTGPVKTLLSQDE